MKLLDLVSKYNSEVSTCLSLFNETFGRTDLIRAWREGKIPQEGQLPGAHYRLHGVGCAVEYEDRIIDFDFGNWTETGFDAWRLWSYANQFPKDYPDYQDLTSVEMALKSSEDEGKIAKFPDNGKLFRFPESECASRES
jgi:hypothetical protein